MQLLLSLTKITIYYKVLFYFSSLFWLIYGYVKHDKKIVLVNIIGIVLMSGYTCVFYIYTLKKSVVVKQCVASCLIFVCVILYISGDKDTITFYNHLGMYRLNYDCEFLNLNKNK